MYFARTLLVPVLLMGGLMEVASAQHRYVFPQFAFGGGWESTLTVWPDNRASVGPTTCTFSAQERLLTMRDDENDIHTGTEITVASRLGPAGGLFTDRGQGVYNLLKTETPDDPEASSGMAILDCDKKVEAAYTLFSLSINGSLVGEALVEPSEEIMASDSRDFASAKFTADHRDGARFGVALANPSNQSLVVRVLADVLDDSGVSLWTTVAVPANSAKAFFIDELERNLEGRVAWVSVWPDNYPGPSVYAVGLRVNGSVFTTIPAIVDPGPESPAEDTPLVPWSHSGVGNTVFDKPTSAARVRVTGEYAGRGQNFIVDCGGRLMINTIIGTSRSPSGYSGIHNMGHCGEVEIVSSEGVQWSFTEVQ